MTKDGLEKAITLNELREHDKEDSPWFVVNGEVYDGTAFLQGHPGGASSITSAAAMDSTDEFMAIRKSLHTSHHHTKPILTNSQQQTAKTPKQC